MSAIYDLAVIGAGPAGMEAAIAAAEHGARAALIEQAPLPGGQYYKALPAEFEKSAHSAAEREGKRLRQRLAALGVAQFTQALVWGLFPEGAGWKAALYGPRGAEVVRARCLVLAAGAYDTPLAFPGWTLPGVITAGAAQILVKQQGVLPGRRALVAGSGPLILAAAGSLIRAGVKVEAVLEGSHLFPQALGHALAVWGQWGRLAEGVEYGTAMLRGRTPYRLGWAVIEARGSERVEEVVIARLDRAWRPVAGTERSLAVDTLVIGYGLTPNTGLSRLLGCEHVYARERGGWAPLRNERLQTSLAGVYAAGDMAGIGGAGLARLEGRLCGLAAAEDCGLLAADEAQRLRGGVRAALAAQRRFARMLGALFTPQAGLFSIAREDTLVCRCEEISLGEVRRAVAAGARSLAEVKMITRAGMGSCQGRMCEGAVSQALADALGVGMEAVGAYTVRPPLHPLPVAALAEAAGEEGEP